jgi:hypothetical protein
MHFYLGTEAVGDDESRARVFVMELCDCKERLRFFKNAGASDQQIHRFEAASDDIRTRLSANIFFARLPAKMQKRLRKGATASIDTLDEILDRMGVLNQKERALLDFIYSHADLSPLSYCRTGENNRGRGEENDVDKQYIATAVEIACDFVNRASADMQILFREELAVSSQKTRVVEPNDRVRLAIDFVLHLEGGHIDELTQGSDLATPLLCSDCFHDEGLRLSAVKIGQRDMSRCPNCNSRLGTKLSRKNLAALVKQFFVSGTVHRLPYGAAPTVQFNQHQSTSIDVATWLEPDLRLIEKTLHVGFFPYGPRLWMIGEVVPLKALQEPSSRADVISRILDEYPGRILNTDECFYRLRKGPTHPGAFDQYDPPPGEMLGEGRFDTAELPILYGSQDLEVCLHECRVAADDELYVAKLAPLRQLKLLNLAEALWEENTTEFESLDMALHMLFLAGRHSYEISREIASAAHKRGFDGLVYPSYFTLLRTGATPLETTFGISHRRFPGYREHARKNTISNLALFGRPIANGSITVNCVNRVILNKVDYTLHFGPLLVD